MINTLKQIKRHLQPGERILLPSTEGLAIMAEIVSDTPKDYLIIAGGIEQFVSKDTVKNHGILLPQKAAKAYITQRTEDPENKLVFLRYVYKETWIDRLYNWYSNKYLLRPDRSVIEGIK